MRRLVGGSALAAVLLLPAVAQVAPLSTTATEPVRFVAAHGRDAVVMGYGADGLEVWAYPFEIADRYKVSFVPEGAVDAVPGATILRRIEYLPDAIVRTYVGDGYVVRERLFVPLQGAGAIVRYIVEGRTPVAIRVSFLPEMNLMWPGAVGGQGVGWNDALHGYVVSEGSEHFTGTIASPQVVAHSEAGNPTLRASLAQTMVLRPAAGADGVRRAQLFFGLDEPGTAPGTTVQQLETQGPALAAQARQHYATLLDTDALHVDTPDAKVNRAIAWSEVALDQAWVCNPRLGCGMVAGYGPSRGMRRPQYDWFFAGDGLEAMRGLLAAGEYDRARAELAFILRYQNPSNGMIWHELSQSAGFLDWAGKYPYMYVHVDITFDFLAGMGEYLRTTGDGAFVQQHWAALERAYGYCQSVIDPVTGLPRIPAGKEGADEQVRMRDSTGLSSEWLAGAQAYAAMARATGHAQAAQAADAAAERAHKALAQSVWDTATNFWLAGHAVNGAPIASAHSSPSGVLTQGVLTPAELETAMEQLASSRFQTDWGMRSLRSDAPAFNPDSYAQGSVSALATAEMAAAFWQEHRPQAAWQMWQSLLPWFELDSLGHMHEVLAGDFFTPQEESVPEQTWSSAGFLDATVRGLLGVGIDAASEAVVLAPHLPVQWDHVAVSRLHVPGGEAAFELSQKAGEVDVSLHSDGRPFELRFAPQIALGAEDLRADCDGHAVAVHDEQTSGDEQAQLRIRLTPGDHACRILYRGGVRIVLPRPPLEVGDASTGLRLDSVRLQGHTLLLHGDVWSGAQSTLQIATPWKLVSAEGATASQAADGTVTVDFSAAQPMGTAGYRSAAVTLVFSTPEEERKSARTH
jgi:glycogen debranching enzyme